jgi:transposase
MTFLGLPRFGGHLELGQKMKMNTRRAFSDEFKTEAVRRVLEDGKTPSAVARELGVSRQVIAAWLRRATALTGKKPRSLLGVDDRAELKRVRRELDRVKLELEFAKKAAAFFARGSL